MLLKLPFTLIYCIFKKFLETLNHSSLFTGLFFDKLLMFQFYISKKPLFYYNVYIGQTTRSLDESLQENILTFLDMNYLKVSVLEKVWYLGRRLLDVQESKYIRDFEISIQTSLQENILTFLDMNSTI